MILIEPYTEQAARWPAEGRHILAQADADTVFVYPDAWAAAINRSDVRLQWDPDHDPYGGKLPRRAIQLGLRGAMLAAFGQREILEVIDMTGFVAERLRLAG
jgi:Domain of unknown function (DUF4291)